VQQRADDGAVESREVLAFPADRNRAVIPRRVRALDAPTSLTVSLEPRRDYDEQPITDAQRQLLVALVRR
jgi:hypothetical protein